MQNFTGEYSGAVRCLPIDLLWNICTNILISTFRLKSIDLKQLQTNGNNSIIIIKDCKELYSKH